MRFHVLLLLILVTSGCIPYPILKTIQPEAKIKVIDHANKPLSGVQVTLISSAYPYGIEEFRESQSTNALGQVEFNGKRAWRMEMMFLHGWKEYFWDWCVEKQGYATFETRHNSVGVFDDDASIRLIPGKSTPCQSSKHKSVATAIKF